jgi:mRNA-degrading endonuclease RelE of RelBE toxin-antitoxin system
MFTIVFAESVADDLKSLRAYERNLVLDTIDEQLTHEPLRHTRNKKELQGLVPPWEYVPPVWELRISEFRVFYDVDAEISVVTVRAVRCKPASSTTEDIV